MTREETEKKIAELLNQIWSVYKEYNPDGEYLTTCHYGDGERVSIRFNNEYWEKDMSEPVHCFMYLDEVNGND